MEDARGDAIPEFAVKSDPIEDLVVEYLRRRGLTRTLSEFGAESGTKLSTRLPPPPPQTQLGSSGRIHCNTFALFHEWISSSVDIFRDELMFVSFAVFVASYLSLVRENALGDVLCAFLTDWSPLFRAAGLGPECDSLARHTSSSPAASSSAGTSNQENHFIRAATASKFVVYLSEPVLSLLKSYLTTCDLPLLVSLLNSHLDCKLRSASNVLYPIHLPGYKLFDDAAESATMPQVRWGVPGGPASPQAVPDARSDRFLHEVVEKLVLPSALAAESRRRRREMRGDLTEDPTSAASVLDENINPSVIFSTVANTYGSTVCMDINDTASQVVCGFRDSIVRVFSTQQPLGRGHDRPSAPLLPPRSAASPWAREVLPAPRIAGIKRSKVADPYQDSFSSLSSSTGAAHLGLYPSVELRGHSRPVFSVSQFSSYDATAASRLVLSGSADETVRLWDAGIGSCICKYSCVSGIIWAVKFAPCGYFFATCNQNGTASMYSTDRVAPLRMLCEHTSDVTCCTWHPNFTYLVTGSDDRTARLWDIRSATCARVFGSSGTAVDTNRSLAPASAPTCLAVSRSGGTLSAGFGAGRGIVNWDIGTGRVLSSMASPGTVHSLAFSDDDAALVAGCADCAVRVYDTGVAHSISENSSASSGSTHVADTSVIIRARHTFFSKQTPVLHVSFAARGLVVAGGAYRPTFA